MKRIVSWDPEEYFYDKFLPKLFKHEGGYQNEASDKGNYVSGKLIGTNHGISAPVLKTYLGRTPTVSEMKNLTKEKATDIYKKNYWTSIKVSKIADKYVAIQYADMYVNGGGNSILIMKRALNNLGNSLVVDYTLNNSFINHINKEDSALLHEEFKKERILHYKNIIKKDPSQKMWEDGWIKRAKSFIYGKD